ncbi:unnamed protein product [Closterium sp. NIES-65]|nr:unnamed protein product [Closterium sp. NIES-65]
MRRLSSLQCDETPLFTAPPHDTPLVADASLASRLLQQPVPLRVCCGQRCSAGLCLGTSHDSLGDFRTVQVREERMGMEELAALMFFSPFLFPPPPPLSPHPFPLPPPLLLSQLPYSLPPPTPPQLSLSPYSHSPLLYFPVSPHSTSPLTPPLFSLPSPLSAVDASGVAAVGVGFGSVAC